MPIEMTEKILYEQLLQLFTALLFWPFVESEDSIPMLHI